MKTARIKWILPLMIFSMLITVVSVNLPGTFFEITAEIKAAAEQYVLGATVEAAIDENGDTDFYTFEVTEASNVEIYTQGPTDTFGTLMDDTGLVIAKDDDSSEEKNFVVSGFLVPGIYYLEIRDFYNDRTGIYTLLSTASMTSKDTAGNTMETAAVFDCAGATTDHAVDYAGDVDFFKISVTLKTLITADTQGGTDTFGTLYDQSGQVLVEDDDGYTEKNFILSMTVEPGIYYLSVKDFHPEKWGAYKLSFTLTDLEDQDGNTRSEATLIALNQTLDAGIDYPDDTDYFKFTIERKGVVEIITQGDTDTLGVLEDSGGTKLATDDDSGSLKNFKMVKALVPGVYFIYVKDFYSNPTGTYALTINYTADMEDDYGDEMDFAYEIMLDSRMDGFISTGGDIDCFRFSLDHKQTVIIYTTGTTDTFGTLYDKNGTVLFTKDDISGTDKNFSMTETLEPGIYYISIRNYYNYLSGFYSMFLKTADEEEQTVFVLDSGDANPCAFAYDSGRYAFIGCNTTPARIVKFDIQEMKKVISIDLPAGENRDETRVASLIAIGPDTIIHASFTNPCVFTKIDGNTMTISGTLQGEVEDVNDKYIRGLAFDGKYVYAATDSTPSKIIKIDPVTMTRVDAVTFDDPRLSCCFAITICGRSLVGVCDTVDDKGSAIFRINLDDLHQTPEIIQIPGVCNYHSICTDGNYIYAATFTDPINVVKIDPNVTPMNCLATFAGQKGSETGNFTIAYDGTSIVAGTWNFNEMADHLIKLDVNTLNRKDTMDSPSRFPSDLMYVEPYFYTSADQPTGIVNRFKYR